MGWLFFFLLNFYSTIHTLCTVAYLSDSPDLKPALTQVEREKSALYLVILDHSVPLCVALSLVIETVGSEIRRTTKLFIVASMLSIVQCLALRKASSYQ